MRFLPVEIVLAISIVGHLVLPCGQGQVRGMQQGTLRTVTAPARPWQSEHWARQVTSTNVAVGSAEAAAGSTAGGGSRGPATLGCLVRSVVIVWLPFTQIGRGAVAAGDARKNEHRAENDGDERRRRRGRGAHACPRDYESGRQRSSREAPIPQTCFHKNRDRSSRTARVDWLLGGRGAARGRPCRRRSRRASCSVCLRSSAM